MTNFLLSAQFRRRHYGPPHTSAITRQQEGNLSPKLGQVHRSGTADRPPARTCCRWEPGRRPTKLPSKSPTLGRTNCCAATDTPTTSPACTPRPAEIRCSKSSRPPKHQTQVSDPRPAPQPGCALEVAHLSSDGKGPESGRCGGLPVEVKPLVTVCHGRPASTQTRPATYCSV